MENRFNESTKRAKLTRRLISALALSLGLSLFMPSAAPVFGQQAPEAQTPERTSEVADQTQAPSPSELSRTTSIFSRSGGSEGVGFSIPSNTAKQVKERLLGNAGAYARANTGANTGVNTPVSRGYLGVSVQDQQTAGGGVVVAELTNGGPASTAGLRGGDMIVEFDGKQVRSSRQLAEIIASTPVGRTVELKFVRNGQAQTASITLAERPGRRAA